MPINRPMSIAMVGTRGVPARYGGFETCVEEVGARLVDRGHRVVVYCRQGGQDGHVRMATYRGMELVQRGSLHRRSLETLSHTGLSVAHLARNRTDAAIVFNSANAPWMPVLRAARVPFATHVDGLEWQRAKWGGIGKRYYQVSERLSVRWSDALIADAGGIADYYRDRFDADTELISYGAPILQDPGTDRLASVGARPGEFHLVVSRFEPENHVLEIVEGYVASAATKPLVVVGSAPYADAYTDRIRSAADGRVMLLGGVWDQTLLDQLYFNAYTYLHGHSVGGTNPSLLRAIGASAPTIAFDVVFNREVLGDAGRFFTGRDQVGSLIEQAERDVDGTARLGRASVVRARSYDWNAVAAEYEQLCARLVAGSTRRHASGDVMAQMDDPIDLASRRRAAGS